ncbi:MAG: anaerobic ribonucleoside-triphosphate reductase [Christensenellales bacterium]|nr:anaerobic ribonucleoside-triphosphate reductase [Christensenellales bacterium]
MTRINAIHCTLTPEEESAYIQWATEKYGTTPLSMDIEFDGEYANIHTCLDHRPFERIRRITGYLVGTLDRFNDAKASEERDRVKHQL